MIRPTTSRLIFSLVIFFASQTIAIASNDNDRGHYKDSCDVVSINGTGKMLPDGRIIGNEKLTVMGTDKSTEVSFVATTLGALKADQDTGSVTVAASHDFTGISNPKVRFTTFDEITIVPLGGTDSTCTQNPCGLIFKLKVENGYGRYNSGEIVSGFNADPLAGIPFTSYVNPFSPAANGDTVVLNSIGKLCKFGEKD